MWFIKFMLVSLLTRQVISVNETLVVSEVVEAKSDPEVTSGSDSTNEEPKEAREEEEPTTTTKTLNEKPDYFGAVYLDNYENVHLSWTLPDEEGKMEFKLIGNTEGWIGVGFHMLGQMDGADLVVAWVDDSGQPHLVDHHGSGHHPQQDLQQDYQLLDLVKDGRRIEVRFTRLVDTGDKDDFQFDELDEELMILYAYNTRRRFDNRNYFSYHGLFNRGSKEVKLTRKNQRTAKDIPSNAATPWSQAFSFLKEYFSK